MRIELKNKDISLAEFKEMFAERYWKGYHPDLLEKILIREWEQATGKKHGEIKGASKERKTVSKGLAKYKKSGTE